MTIAPVSDVGDSQSEQKRSGGWDMAGLSGELQMQARMERLTGFSTFVSMNLIGIMVNTFLVLSFAATATTAGKLCLFVSTLAVSIVGPVAARTILAEIDALRKDHAKAFEGSAYISHIASIPIAMFGMLSVGLNLLAFLVHVWTIYGG